MKIISWNVNSVRARIDNIKDYIKDSSPDILFLQEIKTQNENFPANEFEKLGYRSYVHGQKSYNGVALIGKYELNNVNTNFIEDDLKQSRIITGELIINNKKIELIFTDLNTENKKLHIKEQTEKPICIIVGPEGDFSEIERKEILSFNGVNKIKVNENILRSETAAISAISIINYALNL